MRTWRSLLSQAAFRVGFSVSVHTHSRLFAALVRKEELRAETGMLAGASPECGLPVAGSFSGPGEWSRLGMFEPSMVCSPGLALKVQSELFAD